MTRSAARAVGSSPWSPREAELLAVTLRLLQEEGYDGLTVDAVAAGCAGQQGDGLSAVADEGRTGVGGIHRRRPPGRCRARDRNTARRLDATGGDVSAIRRASMPAPCGR